VRLPKEAADHFMTAKIKFFASPNPARFRAANLSVGVHKVRVIALAGLIIGVSAGAALAAGSVERGDYLVNSIMACGNCHTPIGAQGFEQDKALSGRLVEESPAFTAISANLTPAGPTKDWTDEQLAKAIREGIRPDGTLIGPPMPFEVYSKISDDDLASIVAYLRTVPAIENDPGTSKYNIPLPPAWGPPVTTVAAVPEGVTVEYGAYLAGPLGHCTVCHTPQMQNGQFDFENQLGAGGMQFAQPDGSMVTVPNITPNGIGEYTDEQIATIITHGKRPDGSAMHPPMPYGFFANMKPDDVSAIILYLRSLPPKG
jgi:mono/diheme cytochrome c family protein